MSCGNNCAGCACNGDTVEVTPEERIQILEDALKKVIIACTEEHWSKHDIKRIALGALKD